ncbi:MAG: hypothetical protein R2877_00550 [Bdellovibrionota bacterium]
MIFPKLNWSFSTSTAHFIDSAKDLAICLDLALKEDGLTRHTMDDLISRISIGSKNLMRELVNDDPHAERRVFNSTSNIILKKCSITQCFIPTSLNCWNCWKIKRSPF